MTRPPAWIVLLWSIAALLLGAGAWCAVGAQGAAAAATVIVAEAPPPDATLAAPQVSVPRGSLGTPLLPRLRSLVGMFALLVLAWGLSVDRSRVPWRVVLWGVGLQVAFAVFILKTPLGEDLFGAASAVVVQLLEYTVDGARFIFGNLVRDNVPVGTGALDPGAPFTAVPGQVARTGASFAFNVLPTIIFFSSLMTVLYHLGIMQLAVRGVAWVMQRTMRTSGAETLSAAGNIFVGQTEAPLLIKPFIERMTMSELMAVMTGGFATVAGGVLAAYVGILLAYFPDIAGHLMAASVMSAPAALVVAKLMYPERGEPETAGTLRVEIDRADVNVIDAAARGASDGLFLALNVGAMLLAFIALIAMVNGILAWFGGFAWFEGLVGSQPLTLERLLGSMLAPLAWLMGVPWADAPEVGSLMGIKTIVNEFVAYLDLAGTLASEHDLEPRSIIIATYALSGFANFSSIAVQIGGIGGIAPSRRQDLSRIGLRAMIAGSIAAFMTATVAGMVL